MKGEQKRKRLRSPFITDNSVNEYGLPAAWPIYAVTFIRTNLRRRHKSFAAPLYVTERQLNGATAFSKLFSKYQ